MWQFKAPYGIIELGWTTLKGQLVPGESYRIFKTDDCHIAKLLQTIQGVELISAPPKKRNRNHPKMLRTDVRKKLELEKLNDCR